LRFRNPRGLRRTQRGLPRGKAICISYARAPLDGDVGEALARATSKTSRALARRSAFAFVEFVASLARAGRRVQPSRSAQHRWRWPVLLLCRAVADSPGGRDNRPERRRWCPNFQFRPVLGRRREAKNEGNQPAKIVNIFVVQKGKRLIQPVT
jgi:hypothetical protein